MADPIISVEALSKKFLIRHQGQATHSHHYLTLRDELRHGLGGLVKKLRRQPGADRGSVEEFWALRDVSFRLQQGEVLGIIGRNGAGKSTLLKMLSRISEPTSGRIRLRGRVASLLEVGTGFHPELTVRENIFLNGAILGMSRAEIRSKFDEIVSFAGVEKFLDTPVKRYSSGMYLRLAFAVAAHLEPEILVVDEVLAVGDAEFQKKCLGKMESVAQSGRTVLFVSHYMEAIRRMSSRILWLDRGCVMRESTDVSQTVQEYLRGSGGGSSTQTEWRNESAVTNPHFHLRRLALTDSSGRPLKLPISNDQPVHVLIEASTQHPEEITSVGICVTTDDGIPVFQSDHTDTPPEQWPKVKHGDFALGMVLPARFLNAGRYRFEITCGIKTRWIFKAGAGNPSVSLEIEGGLSDSPYWVGTRSGVVAPVFTWHQP